MKTIYKPKGSAGEYAKWACNLYVGCSNDCAYCYCKKGVLSAAMGGNVPVLKKSVGESKAEALFNFSRDLLKNKFEIQRDGGLFFTFTSDPLLPETKELNLQCIMFALKNNVPVKILTKCTAWADVQTVAELKKYPDLLTIGFTLTGHDDLEPNAATNRERVVLMRDLYQMGFHTWASIEPVVDLQSSLMMVNGSSLWCDHYKVGLMSGKRPYMPSEMPEFMRNVEEAAGLATVMWKRSVMDYLARYDKQVGGRDEWARQRLQDWECHGKEG